ncbi:unnamed protein product [Orchesella dallaii]|uniref:Uncharacterized protein n=1 Tax=Orchesella dallaii TaxID=48710 RepID=A0ABP1QU68_9HEXA
MTSRIFTLFLFGVLGIAYHGAQAGVTVLVEKATVNKTASSPPLPASAIKELSKLASVTQPEDRILLTKDKASEGTSLWRTDAGDLVNLIPVKDTSSMKSFYPTQEAPINTLRASSQEFENDVSVVVNGKPPARMMRTFWPFTSLFGYDYDYPPPMYGPVMPMPMMPMGPSGFGMGMGMGMGMIQPPPPPLLGLGYGRW